MPNTAIFADVYYDGAAGASGATGIRLTADVHRTDLCSAIGSCDHGYTMPLPRSLLNAQAHDVYAYGINHTAGGVNTLLSGSPKKITCAAPPIPKGTVKRHVVDPTILKDWRFDTFEDMAPYTAAELAAVPDGTDLAVAPDIVQVTGNPAVYVIDESHARHVVNPAAFSAWRMTSSDVKPITASNLAALTSGPDWQVAPLLVKDPNSPAVYLLDVPLTMPGTDGGAGDSEGGAGGSVGENPDAGSDDAGGWGDVPSGSSGGCSTAPVGRAGGSAWLLSLALVVFGASRRVRARRRR